MTFSSIVDKAINLANPFVGIIISVAVLYFLWGVAQFVLSAGDEKKVEEGRKTMLWGIIALFVMIAMWGLVALLLDTFGLYNTSTVNSFI